MNCANALIMITLGAAMAAVPHAVPDWFPPTAIDGSSTRALWMSVVGTAQSILAMLWLGRDAWAKAWQRIQAGMPAARVKPSGETDAVETAPLRLPVATVLEPVGSITINGEYAELWRAFQTALASKGPAAQLAEQALALAQHEMASEASTVEDRNAIRVFIWPPVESASESGGNERQVAA